MFSQAAFSATPYSSILRIDAAVALTGVTTTCIIGPFTAIPGADVTLTGVTTTCVVGNVIAWGQWAKISPDQNPDWEPVDDSQANAWADVDVAQTPNWKQIAA